MNGRPIFVVLAVLAASSFAPARAEDPALTLWYRQPAARWVEALPVGNGSLGGMVFGGPAREQIQFNEETVWTGHPRAYQHPGAVRFLPEIRKLLAAGKQAEAEELAMKEFMGEPVRQKAYQAFGDLLIETQGVGTPTNYKRSLNLDTGIATTEFTADGVVYRRDVFASYPANAIVVHVTASKAAAFSADARTRPSFDAPLVRSRSGAGSASRASSHRRPSLQ